ncbi:glycosyltransferase family 4 protein [Proteiniborus sp. MB09-C3]|uniref:glycosyltransferase family 4 protein n=1 Tax=Proteiniborus sp. MB09-C3 TaxID=3050072 RepID=UPI002552DAA3|nr:glycosyltransferase family 4 protein [Proteiniborus sp. MB09-C3]WIV12364.1 glycosyltransferase family 4 protein [Proteiniborus sp. MB09-C3]
MKILLTTDTFSPSINGVVISVKNLYKELTKRGHEVRILTLSFTGYSYKEGDIYYLRSFDARIYPGARGTFSYKNRFIKEIIKWSPDIVHSHTEFCTLIHAKYIKKRLRLPHIHTYHTMYDDYLCYIFKGKLISKRRAMTIIKKLIGSVDEIITPTQKAKGSLNAYGINRPISIIPTGIDLSRFTIENQYTEKIKGIRNNIGIKEKDKVLIFLGRLGKEKNIDEIIMNVKELNQELDIKMLIVGGGPYMDNLKKMVNELGLEERIVFTGMVPPEEVPLYYSLANIFVTASTSETQGLTYIEALASGLPVVCRYDEAAEGLVINGTNGYMYNNKEEFKQSIKSLISKSGDIQELRGKAKNSVERFSLDVFASEVEKLYLRHIVF